MTRSFRRPLGLVLPGGGALGAWQAAVLAGLIEGGLEFDRIVGFSAGSLCGTGYMLGRMEELIDRWRDVDRGRILRFSPKLSPLTIFSSEAMWEAMAYARDDARARSIARCDLTVIAYSTAEKKSEYFRFSPQGVRGWHGPLAEKLMASCAIPTIFPPVQIGERSYIDGVVPGSEPMRFVGLEDCADVISIEPVKNEEAGATFWNPWRNYEQQGRDVVLRHMSDGFSDLAKRPSPPRAFRLQPSAALTYSMLTFRSRWCVPAMDQGRRDAESFLKSPQAVPA